MELTLGYILHQTAYRETSSLVDVITQDYGRVRCVARGIRQKQNRRQSFPQLFQPFHLSWVGHGELVTLNTYEVSQPAIRLQGNASFCGLYINELLLRLLPLHEADQNIFANYDQTIDALQQTHHEEITLRLFEKQLLSHLGYGLELNNEADTGATLQDDRQYIYDLERGPVQVRAGGQQRTISGRSLRHLKSEMDFDDQSLNEIKWLMRRVLDHYLGGKPLQSRKLFAQLQQLKT